MQLFGRLGKALDCAANRNPSCDQYIGRLVPELESANLIPNPLTPETSAPTRSWAQIFEDSSDWESDVLLRCIRRLGPISHWIRADDFYPESEHRYFSENVWGSLIAGEEDALFSSNGRFIALLIVVDMNITYPLHAHRIEELYFVLSGNAEWSHDGKKWEVIPPGSVFHNSSYQPHTMRTSDSPLLAMAFYLPPFGWEGGLVGVP